MTWSIIEYAKTSHKVIHFCFENINHILNLFEQVICREPPITVCTHFEHNACFANKHNKHCTLQIRNKTHSLSWMSQPHSMSTCLKSSVMDLPLSSAELPFGLGESIQFFYNHLHRMWAHQWPWGTGNPEGVESTSLSLSYVTIHFLYSFHLSTNCFQYSTTSSCSWPSIYMLFFFWP